MGFNTAPRDAQYLYGGFYYKVGHLCFVYAWTGQEWMKSTRPLHEIRNGKRIEGGELVKGRAC